MSDFTTNFISWSWSSLTRNTTEWIAKLLRQMCFLYRFSEACQKTWKEFFSFTKATRIFKIRHKIKIELFLQENLHFLFHYRFFYCLWTSTFFSISFHLIWLFYYFNIFFIFSFPAHVNATTIRCVLLLTLSLVYFIYGPPIFSFIIICSSFSVHFYFSHKTAKYLGESGVCSSDSHTASRENKDNTKWTWAWIEQESKNNTVVVWLKKPQFLFMLKLD